MHTDQTGRHRRAVLQTMLIVTTLAALAFAALNFPDGMRIVASIQVILAVTTAGLLVVVRRTERIQLWCLSFMLLLLSAAILLLSRPEISPYAFLWLLVIPLVTHLLLGSQWGLWLALGYMGAGGALYLHRFGADPERMQVEVLANAIIAALAILSISYFYERMREQSEQALLELAMIDPLTGLANRMRLRDVFQRQVAETKRLGTPLSLLILDLDLFKQINDAHGHEAGDEVLIVFARMLKKRLREADLVARAGGEEFIVLLHNTDSARAVQVAEALRDHAENLVITYRGKTLTLTVSIGVAEYGPDGRDLDTLSRVADERLYQAKERGRNRTISGHRWHDNPEPRMN